MKRSLRSSQASAATPPPALRTPSSATRASAASTTPSATRASAASTTPSAPRASAAPAASNSSRHQFNFAPGILAATTTSASTHPSDPYALISDQRSLDAFVRSLRDAHFRVIPDTGRIARYGVISNVALRFVREVAAPSYTASASSGPKTTKLHAKLEARIQALLDRNKAELERIKDQRIDESTDIPDVDKINKAATPEDSVILAMEQNLSVSNKGKRNRLYLTIGDILSDLDADQLAAVADAATSGSKFKKGQVDRFITASQRAHALYGSFDEYVVLFPGFFNIDLLVQVGEAPFQRITEILTNNTEALMDIFNELNTSEE